MTEDKQISRKARLYTTKIKGFTDAAAEAREEAAEAKKDPQSRRNGIHFIATERAKFYDSEAARFTNKLNKLMGEG